MDCEIVTIGSELLLGQIVDTNASYLAEVLNSVGISIVRHTTVGDTMEDIVEALTAAMKRADVVITSGGIGPTEDDLTREASARMLGVTLEYRQGELYQGPTPDRDSEAPGPDFPPAAVPPGAPPGEQPGAPQ